MKVTETSPPSIEAARSLLHPARPEAKEDSGPCPCWQAESSAVCPMSALGYVLWGFETDNADVGEMSKT